ncbi:MAG: hypothetical protein IPM50_07190 [Acidobacteriota bacterium]|nr:MAG: hypothetical protein IPM50_07190 [Acidobacteriota bacterium]
MPVAVCRLHVRITQQGQIIDGPLCRMAAGIGSKRDIPYAWGREAPRAEQRAELIADR